MEENIFEPTLIANEDSEEDDSEGYFLQSTAGGYDIKEKIKAANDNLFEDYESETTFREHKVSFNDQVDFQTYYSDDAYVNSPEALETDNEIEEEFSEYHQPIEEELIEEFQELSIINHNEIESEEEIVEEVSGESKSDENIIELIQDGEVIDETDLEISVINCDEDSPKVPNTNKKKCHSENDIINCRKHCLEKNDLDFINKGCVNNTRSIVISKELKLNLRQKPCCRNKKKPKLPVYNGLKSEYGLTESQLVRKIQKKERKEQKKVEKSLRVREETIQKDLYNEEIFCSWLKSVAKRNKTNKDVSKSIPRYIRHRPKTACEVYNKTKKSKINRPNTCPSNMSFQYTHNTVFLNPDVKMEEVLIVKNSHRCN